jgi:hypothetical protein
VYSIIGLRNKQKNRKNTRGQTECGELVKVQSSLPDFTFRLIYPKSRHSRLFPLALPKADIYLRRVASSAGIEVGLAASFAYLSGVFHSGPPNQHEERCPIRPIIDICDGNHHIVAFFK